MHWYNSTERKAYIRLKYKAREIARLMKWHFPYQTPSRQYKIVDRHGHEIYLSFSRGKYTHMVISGHCHHAITASMYRPIENIVMNDIKKRFFPAFKEYYNKRRKESEEEKRKKNIEVQTCLEFAKKLGVKYGNHSNYKNHGYKEMIVTAKNVRCEVSHWDELRIDLALRPTKEQALKIFEIMKGEN